MIHIQCINHDILIHLIKEHLAHGHLVLLIVEDPLPHRHVPLIEDIVVLLLIQVSLIEQIEDMIHLLIHHHYVHTIENHLIHDLQVLVRVSRMENPVLLPHHIILSIEKHLVLVLVHLSIIIIITVIIDRTLLILIHIKINHQILITIIKTITRIL